MEININRYELNLIVNFIYENIDRWRNYFDKIEGYSPDDSDLLIGKIEEPLTPSGEK